MRAMKRPVTSVVLAIAGLLAAAPALAADRAVTAGPAPNSFSTTTVTMDQGDTVTFHNDDASGALHDVTSDKNGSDGAPLFKSALIEGGKGKTSAVSGVEYLTTGDYGFHCSVHPFMTGTLKVSANGTPKTRPQPDTTAPDADIKVSDTRISKVLKRKALGMVLAVNEHATLKLKATAKRTTVASASYTLDGVKTDARLKLTRAGKKLLARSRRLTIKVTAVVTDDVGNRSSATTTKTLK
jgi:plastocyanin